MNCGDVITAAAGTYSNSSFAAGEWGTVTCAANNSAAWVKCATFDACKISVAAGGSSPGMHIDNSYWACRDLRLPWRGLRLTTENASGRSRAPSTLLRFIT